MSTNRSLNPSHITCLVSTLSSVLTVSGFAQSTVAQVIPDNTTSSVAITSNDLVSITGGTRSGNILFHSFDKFSVSPGQMAQFLNDLDLTTLITRVTGTESSIIDGTLAAQGSADVFLLNPNGIVFGETATLDVGGSFIATTADSILFDNNQQFSAVAPQGVPLLTMSAPVGLQYGLQPSGIQVLGEGNGFVIDPDTFEVLPSGPRPGLSVPTGSTLALLGGEVMLDGGNLTSSEGRVVLWGAGSQSTLDLGEDPLGWTFQQFDSSSLADVSLLNASSILTSGNGGGAVQIEGQTIELLAGSTILSNTQGDAAGSGVALNATESINVLGTTQDSFTGEASFLSSILSEVDFDATADGGSIQLTAPAITIADGAQVSTSVFGFGLGGDITVQSKDVTLSGSTAEFGSSGFFLSVEDGTGGAFLLQSDRLRINDGAVIDGSTFGVGNSGGITINSSFVDIVGADILFDASGILSQVEGEGNSGNITIQGDVLNISAGPNISTRVFGQGNGGNINLLVDKISLKDGFPEGDEFRSGIISASVQDDEIGQAGTGQAGDINILTQQLTIAEGAGIDSSTINDQRAGDVSIQAQLIDLIGVDSAQTGILSVGAVGAGGKIDLETDTLRVRNGAQIVTGTLGAGNGNDLQIRANAITLDGRNNEGRSGLYASALNSIGAGGSIFIETASLDIQNGATINAGNFPSINRVPGSIETGFVPGQGAAGSIDITANLTQLRNEGTITTSTFTGDQGNIRLESDVVVARNDSAITTNASQTATGGNITILSDFVVAVPDENSDITANAQQGQGGRVDVTAQQVYGLTVNDSLTPSSDITASSEVGLDGEVAINRLEVDPSNDLVRLPNTFVDKSDQVTAGCPANQGANFVATGQGGLPADLSQQVQSFAVLPAFERGLGGASVAQDSLAGKDQFETMMMRHGSGLPVTTSTQEDIAQESVSQRGVSQESVSQRAMPLVEAQSWRRNPDGSVALVASADVTNSTQSACLGREAV